MICAGRGEESDKEVEADDRRELEVRLAREQHPRDGQQPRQHRQALRLARDPERVPNVHGVLRQGRLFDLENPRSKSSSQRR